MNSLVGLGIDMKISIQNATFYCAFVMICLSPYINHVHAQFSPGLIACVQSLGDTGIPALCCVNNVIEEATMYKDTTFVSGVLQRLINLCVMKNTEILRYHVVLNH